MFYTPLLCLLLGLTTTCYSPDPDALPSRKRPIRDRRRDRKAVFCGCVGRRRAR